MNFNINHRMFNSERIMSNCLKYSLVVLIATGISAIGATVTNVVAANKNEFYTTEVSPFIDILLCPLDKESWQCTRYQSGRMLDIIEDAVNNKKNELKVEADKEFTKKVTNRAFGESGHELINEKPSTVMTSFENYITNGMNNIIGRGFDRKDKKKKKKPNVTVYIKPEQQESHDQDEDHEDEDDDGFEMGELEHILDGDIDVQSGHGLKGGGHGIKLKKKHGRSIGVKRGHKHKKKKKKAIMKLILLGAVLKAKIELLLKIIATHLQFKFFAIAVIGLLINAARFWIDIKKNQQPQKVVYYEHAQHQHHYDDHGDDGWSGGSGGSGGYWKRSLDPANPEKDDKTIATSPYYNSGYSDPQLSYGRSIEEGFRGFVPSAKIEARSDNAHNIAYNAHTDITAMN